MPLDINRHIDRIRAQPGANFLALALKEIQDFVNTPSATAATTKPITQLGVASGGGGATLTPPPPPPFFKLSVNGTGAANNAANLNDALPSPPVGNLNVAWQIDNTLSTPNISANIHIPASAFGGMLPLANGDLPGPDLIADGVGQCIGVPL